ncbi:bifunctional diguanylate cyclase/phosphodiesterase [Brumicola nitratireducens]|uniref:Response regulator receiver modulated diguanylate cyclase/phosphodiesterase with PAS/PAC sensor(S) n=1 Tax=Glaciecola nitratireducens (strain JCM 12485 / KCTC 12276 / FR1064) TaxID=1085623 RepID=G4QN46_GLANF|nr:bifunctional diguanylate cyclase/phosphodiesterase [Glaciecola nitratireducens]AEP31465.1 response regulator receiver modulated diguanylate cyclase/phosphodiesterase with PAS/PAC sensor(s) [Glaciecola nitratireducens FR1064]
MKNKEPLSILLLEKDSFEAQYVQQRLKQDCAIPNRLIWFDELPEGLSYLSNNEIDVVLLSSHFSQHRGESTFNLVLEAAPNTLILFMQTSTFDNKLTYYSTNESTTQLRHILNYVNAQKSSINGLRRLEEELFEEKERAQVTLNSIADAVLVTDNEGNVSYLNSMAEQMTGWSNEEAVGMPSDVVFHLVENKSHPSSNNPAMQAISENKTVSISANSSLIRRDGIEFPIEDSSAPIHNRDNQVTGAVIVFRDISQSQTMANKMAHLAQHDALTGLPNRLLLKERLTQAIGAALRNQTQLALMFLDLDFFKHINDSLGHSMGDRLLVSVASRLASCIRTTDTVCRQGGDEFVILLRTIDEPQDAVHVANKLFAALAPPHHIDGNEIYVSISIGISIFPHDGHTVDQLMQSADIAMYHAKANGRSNFEFFHTEMNIRAAQRQLVACNLRRAIEHNEFVIHYQPQIDLSTGRLSGAEALLRWKDPLLGLVYPNQFIDVAEECGLIESIGKWVMRDICTQIRKWLDIGLDAVPIAVNVSALELRNLGYASGVEKILLETGLDPKYLEIELTENVLSQDFATSKLNLDALSELGVHLAMDGFGTGFSSLSYLRRFPIDILKLDRSIVRNINTSDKDTAVVSAAISMGINLNQRIVAEGVESQAQVDFLLDHHCNIGQGYQFSYPLNANAFSRLLHTK